MGRKEKFFEPTVILHYRVPASKEAKAKQMFKKVIDQLIAISKQDAKDRGFTKLPPPPKKRPTPKFKL